MRTVETHRGHILAKTGCRTRSQLVAYALRAGMLDRDFAAAAEEMRSARRPAGTIAMEPEEV